jgi:hypothetical protein
MSPKIEITRSTHEKIVPLGSVPNIGKFGLICSSLLPLIIIKASPAEIVARTPNNKFSHLYSLVRTSKSFDFSSVFFPFVFFLFPYTHKKIPYII